jgi:hypothetical protein
MTRKRQCQESRTVQNTKKQEQIKKVEAAHFQLCGSAIYPVEVNILSLDRMAKG